jgi:predicted secreted hydrolase
VYDRDGGRYGYQLTFFRVGVDPKPVNPSRWAVRDLFMAHFAVTDLSGKRYRFAERMNRAGPGWAGANTDGYRVWNANWQVSELAGGEHHLVASEGGAGIDLRLGPGKPPVLHGVRGYSRKGSEPGNASQYYSLTRMPTSGVLSLAGAEVPVSGFSWMDHEFGTTFLEPQQVGWDWFSIQLEDGRDLMLFRLRRADGSPDPHSSATMIGPAGETTVLSADQFELLPGRTWTSPESGGRYPVEWRIRVPGSRLDLQVRSACDGQELRSEHSTGVAYWEGAVDIGGSGPGGPVRGSGYLEMTGYAGAPISTRFR